MRAVREPIPYTPHVRNDTSGDDWLEPADAADMLAVPLRTVQESLRDDTLRARWWEIREGGKTLKGWGVKPLTRTTRYRVRRWAVERLLDDPPAGG